MIDSYRHIPVTGVIHSVQMNGDTVPMPFPETGVAVATSITYTVIVNHPTRQIVAVPGIVPVNQRWRAPIKIVPAEPGTGVHGIDRDGILQFTIIEMPGVLTCATS